MLLKTQRLHIRPIQLEDAKAVFAYRSDAIANKYQSWVPQSLAEVTAFIKRNPTQFNLPKTWFQLVLTHKISHEILGDIGLHFIDEQGQQAEIGCTLDKKFQSQGYATEALKAIIDHLFSILKKHRITASIDPNNTKSIRLMERLGFRKEAHHIESYFFKGEWTDDLIYALLAREWPKDQNPNG
ncbi:MAG: GNAT family protein [Bacteroidota bacterium]